MSWAALRTELDRWADGGARATLWWRDDDACEATPELARLVEVATAFVAPVALAVIPARLRDDLADALSGLRSWTVVQHGFAHRNHAPPGERRCELGAHRPAEVCIAELAVGTTRLRQTFAARFLPVLVPPWNRIGTEIVARLADVPLAGLSTFAPRRARYAAAGIVQVNTHVDPIDWRGSRTFAGEERSTAGLAQHLAARRERSADADEPTGLLTHHRVFDQSAWHFVERLLDMTSRHPAVEWLSASSAFGSATCGRSA